MRRTIGNVFPEVTIAAPTLPDIVLGYTSAVGSLVTLNVPTFDPATVNVPTLITVAYVPSGVPIAATPDLIQASAAFVSTAPFPAVAGDISIDAAHTPGAYVPVVLLDFLV